MRLEQPAWLLLAVAALAAGFAAWRWLEGRRSALAFPDGSAWAPRVPGRTTALLRAAPYALKTAALVLIAGALARPQDALRQLAGLTQGIDIFLVLDTSTSMRALDFDPTDRIGAAKETAKRFIGGRTSDRIGLLVFGGAPSLACPLTLDYEALLDTLGGVEAGMTGVEGTAIGDGIAAAVNHFRSSRAASKVLILLTDGRSNIGVIDPITAAKTAASFGIKIYAIGTAKRGEALIPVDDPVRGRAMVTIQDDLDEDGLFQLASATGGKYFRATNFKELASIYAEINRMEKTQVERPKTVAYHDLYPLLLIPALLLLASEMVLVRTWLLRLP